MTPRQRLTRPGGLYRPDRHHPIQACARCGQPWPCATERNRLAWTQAAARAAEVARRFGRAIAAAFNPQPTKEQQ